MFTTKNDRYKSIIIAVSLYKNKYSGVDNNKDIYKTMI